MGGFNLYHYAPNTTGWIDPWGWCGNNQPWKTIIEDEKVVAQTGKLNPQQLRAYEEAIDILAQGKPGRNQHVLTGDRKGTSAIDLVGSGKGRGRMRIIFSETKDGAINIHEIVDYH